MNGVFIAVIFYVRTLDVHDFHFLGRHSESYNKLRGISVFVHCGIQSVALKAAEDASAIALGRGG